MKFFNTKLLAVFLISFSFITNASALEQGTLQVTGITPTQTLAIPDGNFDNGWQWIFNITVPNNETVLRMKFANWSSGTSTIPTATNVRFWSPQSSDTNSTSTAKVLSSANVYSDTIKLDPSFDLSPSTTGRQIQVVVEVRVPSGTSGGSYSSSYGVSTDIDPNQATGVVQYTVDPNYANITINGNHNQQIIGQVLVTAQNEDIKLNTLRLDPKFMSSTTPSFSALRNIKVLLNGTQIGNTTDWALADAPNPFVLNFDNDVILPKGVQKTITVKSDVNFLDNTAVATGTLLTVLGGLTNNAQGVTTNKLISVFSVPFVSATNTLTNYSPEFLLLNSISTYKNTNFSNGTTTPNATAVKVGSFTIQNGNRDDLVITSFNIGISGSLLSSNNLNNLRVRDASNGADFGSLVIGNPTSNNTFSGNLSLSQNASKTLDVYVDVNNGSLANTITTTGSFTIRSQSTNISTSTQLVQGQTFTIEPAILPIINSSVVSLNAGSSPLSQGIVGGSNFQIMTVNVKTTNGIGGAMLRDIVLTASPANAFISATIAGKSATFISGQAVIANTNISVPSNNSGVDIPVTVNVRCVNPTNGCTLTSGTDATLEFSGLSYNNGESSVSINSPVTSNSFRIYNSKPTVTLGNGSNTTTTGLIVGTTNKLGEVTVSADANGQIKVHNITFEFTASGITSPTISNIFIADPTSQVSWAVCNAESTFVPFSVTCSFTPGGGYGIPAGTSKTFSIFGMTGGVPGSAGSSSITVKLTRNGFSWEDDVTNGVTGQSGFFINNFPTNSTYTKTN